MQAERMVGTMPLAVERGVGRPMTRERDADFAAYMAARQPSLLRTAYLLTGDRHTAEDLVQTTFAKLYLSWDRVQRRELVDGYARRILVNEHHSLWRRPFKRREVVAETLPEATAVDRHDTGETAALWAFVQTLPRRQRAVIVLRYYEDLTEVQTAEALGIAVGTVKSQARDALKRLRESVPDLADELVSP
jgi:RNA polymerase sigma-70 factor (sigma-E family)